MLDGGFTKEEIVCIKTLYNYVDLGLLDIKNIALPSKPHRSTKKKLARKNKLILGCSIEERPAAAETSEEFGHRECALVFGFKHNDNVLLTIVERKSRECWVIRLPNRRSDCVMAALETVRSQYSEHFNEVFKTITTDNGS